MNPSDLQARECRLGQLARGLAMEVLLWQEDAGPLLYAEKKAYLAAVQDTRAGVEAARVVLAQARQRLERSWGGRKAVVQTRSGAELGVDFSRRKAR